MFIITLNDGTQLDVTDQILMNLGISPDAISGMSIDGGNAAGEMHESNS
jgi:hypothetical protein